MQSWPTMPIDPMCCEEKTIGRLLQHVSVARSLKVVGTVRNSGDESVHLSFPDGVHSGAVEGHHLILFAQEPHQGAIVGAATIPF